MRDRLALWLVSAALRLCAWLPLETARALGRWFGARYWALDTRRRRIVERNIALAYPQLPTSEQRLLVRQTLEETGALAAEMGHVWLLPWHKSEKLIVETQGTDAVQAALRAGKGVIVLGPHLGNWEILGLHLATLGDMVALYKPAKIPQLDGLIRRSRERSGGRLVATDPRGIAAIVKSVKRGGISGILPDQVPDTEVGALNVPFMGVKCATAALGVNLINRAGALAFMGAAFRVPGGFKVTYVPAPDALYADDAATALTAMNKGIEALLGGYDAQYQWLYKRFRCRPQGQNDHYRTIKTPRIPEK